MNQLNSTSVRLGASVGLDPVIVVAVITALMQVVTLCMTNPTPERVARFAKRPRARHLRAMRGAVEDELIERGYGGDKVDATMRAIRNEFAMMDVAAFEEIMLDVQDQTGDFN
jgi:hypothetical protein